MYKYLLNTVKNFIRLIIKNSEINLLKFIMLRII